MHCKKNCCSFYSKILQNISLNILQDVAVIRNALWDK